MNSNFKIPSPCFILDQKLFRNNLEVINRIEREAGVKIILAFKAFAMAEMLTRFRSQISGFAASSLNEVEHGFKHLKKKGHTYFVAYDEEDLGKVLQCSSHITFNSLSQYHRLKRKLNGSVSVGLRINPEWSDVSTDLYNPASSLSRLGISSSELVQLPEGIDGLHFHVLCESSAESLVKVLEEVASKFGHLLPKIKWINMGGGHALTRSGYNISLLINSLIQFREKYDVEIILEPGSAFAWETGILKSKVLDIVENGGVSTAICDISITCHMPDCLEMPYRPNIRDANLDPTNSYHKYRIGGVSCLAGDFLEEYGFESELSVGDEIIFEDMMHYTMVKSTTFNGIKHPAIAIQMDNKIELIWQSNPEEYGSRLG